MRTVKAQLQLGLHVLSDVAAGNPRFAATKLEELRELCQPLLASKLVGACVAWAAAAFWCAAVDGLWPCHLLLARDSCMCVRGAG